MLTDVFTKIHADILHSTSFRVMHFITRVHTAVETKKFNDFSRTIIMIFEAPKSMACNTSFIIKINATSSKTTDVPTNANDKQLTD